MASSFDFCTFIHYQCSAIKTYQPQTIILGHIRFDMPYFCAMKYSRPSFPSEMRIDVPEEYTDRLLIGDTVLVRRITFTISEFIRTVGHTDEPHDARPPK